MTDVFEECRERLSARRVAEAYHMEFDRAGRARCCFHRPDKHPSMSFKGGGFRCWSCGAHGSSIDLTAQLFGLDALGAVRQLNDDFGLGLPLDKPPDKDTVAAVQRRRETMETYRLFEQWRDGMIRRLNQCFREAHFIMKTLETPADLDSLTDAQTLAIREQARVSTKLLQKLHFSRALPWQAAFGMRAMQDLTKPYFFSYRGEQCLRKPTVWL